MLRRVPSLILLSSALLWVGCADATVENSLLSPTEQLPTSTPDPEPTAYVVPAEFQNAATESLCKRLSEIRALPSKDPNDTDPIYESLIARGDAALPCLIEEVANAKKMRDPRQAPVWQYYAVGDTAVFIILRLVSKRNDDRWMELMLDSLPQSSREEWKTNGVYAYFNYVSESQNRKKLQVWWRDWMKKNKK
ncbi:MAG TPA: hypothetical protein PKD26_15335 [Pyrinomonadaceae bacterium]|nr:hypothetical protein [Pyrinomonadaceae bacterium]